MSNISFKPIAAGLLLGFAVAAPALAESITISEPRAHVEHNKAGLRLEVFMTIDNSGPADRIYAVRSEVSDAGRMSGGIDKREGKGHEDHVNATVIEVPGNGRLAMTGKISHIELTELNREIKVGDTVDVTLFFERAGQVVVSLPITPETEEEGEEGHKEEGKEEHKS